MTAGLGCACLQEAQGLLFSAHSEDSTGTCCSEVTLVLKCSVCVRWDRGNQSAMCNREGEARGKFSLTKVLRIPCPLGPRGWSWVLHSNHSMPYVQLLCFIPENWGSSRVVAGRSRSSWSPLTYLCYSLGLKAPLLSGSQSAILWEASVSVGPGMARAGWVAAVKLHSHKAELMCYSADKPQEPGKGRAWAVIPGAIPGAVWR